MKPRLVIDPSTQLPSIQSFDELSQFLRSAMADEESLQLAEGMGVLSLSIEAVLTRLKLSAAGPTEAAPLLMDLMTTPLVGAAEEIKPPRSPAARGCLRPLLEKRCLPLNFNSGERA